MSEHSVFDDPDEEDERRVAELPKIEKRGPGRPPKDNTPVVTEQAETNKPTHINVNVDPAVDVQILKIILERRIKGQHVTKQALMIEALQLLFAKEGKLRIAAAKARTTPQETGDE